MKKPATVEAVKLASQRRSKDNGTAPKLATLPIKSKVIRDGRRLAYILNKNLFDIDTFHRLYDAYELEYPFHRDELHKAFYAEVNQ